MTETAKPEVHGASGGKPRRKMSEMSTLPIGTKIYWEETTLSLDTLRLSPVVYRQGTIESTFTKPSRRPGKPGMTYYRVVNRNGRLVKNLVSTKWVYTEPPAKKAGA